MYSQGMMGVGGGMPYAAQQPGAQQMSPFQGVMSVLGVVGGIAQFADAALEAVHVFLSLSARLCDRLGWARQELSGAVAAASAAAAAARATRASTSSRTSANLRRLLICAAVRVHDVWRLPLVSCKLFEFYKLLLCCVSCITSVPQVAACLWILKRLLSRRRGGGAAAMRRAPASQGLHSSLLLLCPLHPALKLFPAVGIAAGGLMESAFLAAAQ